MMLSMTIPTHKKEDGEASRKIMELPKFEVVIICALLLLASSPSVYAEAIQKPAIASFQITRMGPRHAQFQFTSQKTGASNPKREVIEVSVERDENIRHAVVRKMIEVIRQYQKEDFEWKSYRLDPPVVLSARMEDSQKLEDFLMREFFIDDQPVEAAPKQANLLSLNPETTQTRGGGLFQVTRMGPRHAQFQFTSKNTGAGNPKREVVEVSVGRDEDIQRAVVRKMIEMIRHSHEGDFPWESYRLGRTVVMSARMEDSKGLEDFLMRDFFLIEPFIEVAPKQVSDLRERGIQGKVIAEYVSTSEGTVREPVIVESSDPALEKVIIEAILKYRLHPLLNQASNPPPVRYRQTFDFGLAGIDTRVSQHDLLKKTDNPPDELQYDTLPVVKVVAPVVYPLNLLRDNISGSAKVTVIVDPDGNVGKVEILKATHPEFGLATRAMMQSWEFEPATKNGKPMWSIFALEQKFNTHARGTEVSQSAKEILKILESYNSDIHDTLASDSLPVALYKPIPVYPSHLAKEGVGDQVMIEFFIDKEGAVQLPHIVEAKNDELAWIALTALSRWHFEPPLRQGRPEVTRIRLPMNFSPSQNEK